MLEKWKMLVIKLGMPLVYAYHLICSSVFLNTAHEEARGLERLGNWVLAPTHYVLAGRVVVKDGTFTQRFDYTDHIMVGHVCALTALPLSLTAGTLIKGLSYLSGEVRARHDEIARIRRTPYNSSLLELYDSFGMQINDYRDAEIVPSMGHKRRAEDLDHLGKDKVAFEEILRILHREKIPCWVDCGTCLGTYRYGGVIPWDLDIDLGMLATDSDRAYRALQALDPAKYVVQDWASRDKPGTYLKVYVRETGTLIDLYHFEIDEKGKVVRSIVSNEDSIFLPESWKIRERRYTVPVEFSTLFPLKRAIFDGIEVPIPNKIEKYLQGRYGENLDPIYLYNERTGRYEKDLTHPYWDLPYVK